MGLVIDTSVLITAERKGLPVDEVLERLRRSFEEHIVLAAATVVELTHGIYRARTVAQQEIRRSYVEQIFGSIGTAPLTPDIARLAGRIDGEQAAVGNMIDFADLLIGATALHLDFEIVTYNVRHFRRIPNVRTVLPSL